MLRTRPVMYKRVRVNPLEEQRRLSVMGFVALFVILPVFLIGLAYVKLNSDGVKLKRQLTEMRRDFGLKSKELANLDLEVEMYRNGSRIFSQVQRLGLGLQMPQRGQVIRVRAGVPTSSDKTHSEAIVAER